MNRKFTLNDEVTRTALRVVGNHAGASYEPKRVVLAGGVANQIYNASRPNLLRPTTDIDFSVYPVFRTQDFRDFEAGMDGELARYNPRLRASGRQYEIKLDDNGYPLFVHFDPNPSARYLQRIRKWLEATHDNANEIDSAEVGAKLWVVRPEDIVVGKMRRLGYADANDLVPKDLKTLFSRVKNRDFSSLSQIELAQFLEEVIRERDILPSFVDADSREFRTRSMEYKVRKDLYDISLLSTRFGELGFDEQYYASSLSMAGTGA